jgi:hypothetical protein
MPQSPKPQIGNARPYRVASVEKTAVPQGAEGDNWCRYVLDNGYTTLMGWRRGSLREIMQHAVQYADALNTRNSKGPSSGPYRRKQ